MLITENSEDGPGVPMDITDFSEQSLTNTGDITFMLDEDCNLHQEDFLQQLSSDLEIPLLLEEGNGARDILDECGGVEANLSSNSHHFEDLVDFEDLELQKWGAQTFMNVTTLPNGDECRIKDEIKTEPPPSPPSSISSLSSLSEAANSSESVEGAVDIKVILETPPISPPTDGECGNSPLLTPCTYMSTNVGTILPTTIISTPQPCVVPQPNVSKFSKGVKVIRPKVSCSSMQVTNSLAEKEVKDSKAAQQAIILTAKEFVALASQLKKGKNEGNGGPVALVTGVSSTPLPEKRLVSVAPSLSCQLGNTRADLEQAKAMKRQQRMIKNRESACLSRKKKKEYVATLEEQLTLLKRENDQLKVENQALKERLGELGVDSSSLSPGSKNLWLGVTSPLPSKSSLSSFSSSSHIFSTNTKKVTAFFAVLLVVSLNIGPFGSLLRNDQIMSSLRRSSNPGSLSAVDTAVPHASGSSVVSGTYSSGRALLWSLGRGHLSSIDSEEDEDEDVSSAEFEVGNSSTPHPTCPLPINLTESIRLDSELRGWFGVESWMAANFSTPEKGSSVLKGPHSWVASQHPRPMATQEKPLPVPGQRSHPRPLPTIETFAHNRLKKKGSKLRQWPLGEPSPTQGSEVAVYGPGGGKGNQRPKYEFSDLLEAIGRREDRFYVVSFSGDHLLLPASAPALNASHQPPRPKMTLLLPAVVPNGTVGAPPDHVTMMQIDCEVTDTQLMTLRQRAIPLHLRTRNTNAGGSGGCANARAAPCRNATSNQSLRKAGAMAALHPYLRQVGVEGKGRL